MAPRLKIAVFGLIATVLLVINVQAQDKAFLPRGAEVDRIRRTIMYPYKYDHYLNELTSMSNIQDKTLGFQLPFFGFAYNYTWVSINGALLFSRAMPTMVYPMKFPNDEWPAKADPSLIGVFFALSTISDGIPGAEQNALPTGIYFKEYKDIGVRSQEEADLKEAVRLDITQGIVGATDFDPQNVLIVTWKNLTFPGSVDKQKTNSYQIMLATDQRRTYAMFNYELIRWGSTSDAGGGQDGLKGIPAYVGFNAGNGTRAFEYKPYSQFYRISDLANLGMVNNHPGRHIFRIDEEIYQGSCNPEPSQEPLLIISPETGHMLGGTILNVTGPCFSPYEKIKLKFHDTLVDCIYRSRSFATCVTPIIYIAGYVDVSITQAGDGTMNFKNKFYVENPMVAYEGVSIVGKAQMSDLDLETFTVQWSKTNLTWGAQAISINLFAYRESEMRPELIFIDSLIPSTANDGEERIDTSMFISKDDGWKRDFKFGMIQINLTNPGKDYLMNSPALWSRPVPLAWYFRKQWENYYGSNWPEKFCEQWDKDDKRLRNFAHEVPRCPCSLEQAVADIGRFAPDFGCNMFGNRECYGSKKIQHCVRSGQPSADGAGQQCCYGFNGDLLMNSDMVEGGIPSRSHPFGVHPYDDNTKVPGLSHWYHDMTAYYTCCLWQNEMSEGCYQFKWRRASQDCIGYQPPNASLVFGDPHFITFDNLEYTFNGLGEYALVSVQDPTHILEVQGRFERIVNEKEKTKLDAALLMSVAMRDNVSVTVEVQMRPMEARWRYHLNVLVDKKRIYFDRPSLKIQSFKGVTVYTPDNSLNQSRIITMFQTGAGVEVLENDGYLSARIFVPKSFMNITRGLMGNYSNDKTDDFAYPIDMDSKAPLSSSSSASTIFSQFGPPWMVDESGKPQRPGSRSLFHHEFGRSSAFYTNVTYVPNFDEEPYLNTTGESLTLDMVDMVCGQKNFRQNYQCRYDYIMTKNKRMAQVTKYNADLFRRMKDHDLKTIITCGALQTPRNGRKSSNEYTVGTIVKFECDKNYVLEGEPVRWCYSTGEWSWAEWGYTRCTPESTYYSKQAGITSGIVLGVLIPCFIAGICLFGYILSKGRMEPNDSNGRKMQWRSGDMNEMKEMKGKDKGSTDKLETDA